MNIAIVGAYQAFILGQQNSNAGVDLADSEGDQHGVSWWVGFRA